MRRYNQSLSNSSGLVLHERPPLSRTIAHALSNLSGSVAITMKACFRGPAEAPWDAMLDISPTVSPMPLHSQFHVDFHDADILASPFIDTNHWETCSPAASGCVWFHQIPSSIFIFPSRPDDKSGMVLMA